MINIDSIICIKLESKKAHRQSTFQSALAKKRCGKIKKKFTAFLVNLLLNIDDMNKRQSHILKPPSPTKVGWKKKSAMLFNNINNCFILRGLNGSDHF